MSRSSKSIIGTSSKPFFSGLIITLKLSDSEYLNLCKFFATYVHCDFIDRFLNELQISLFEFLYFIGIFSFEILKLLEI